MKKQLRYKAYEEIKNKIIYFELKPGEKIFENEIAERLKNSRTPVREALLMLENEGLVVCDPKLGYMVRKVAPKEVGEYFAIRSLIEEFAIPLILEHITPAEIKALEQNIKEAEKCVGTNDINQIMRCEVGFHEILYKATNSEVFVDTINRHVYKFQWLRVIALNSHEGASESLEDHKRMFEAVKKRDANALRRIIKQHIKHAEEKCAVVRTLF